MEEEERKERAKDGTNLPGMDRMRTGDGPMGRGNRKRREGRIERGEGRTKLGSNHLLWTR